MNPTTKIYPFFIPHAGCPHRCLFCSQESTTGREAAPSPGEVTRALEAMLPEAGCGEIAFYGGSFTLLPAERREAYYAAAGPFIREGRAAGIRVSTRPDALGAEIVDELKRTGVSTVEIGCQSFSARVLRESMRGHGPEAAATAARRLQDAGLRVGLQLMPGLPGGDREEAIDSLTRAIALRPDFVRLYPAVVLRGTAMEAHWRAGRYRPLDLEAAVELGADLLVRCRLAGIPVIRLGLQGTPGLDRGEALAAGPYHPAYGQLVRSRLWRRALLNVAKRPGGTTVGVHPADLGDALGHRRENMLFLDRRCGPVTLAPCPELPRETLQRDGRRFHLLELARDKRTDP